MRKACGEMAAICQKTREVLRSAWRGSFKNRVVIVATACLIALIILLPLDQWVMEWFKM